MSEQTMKDPTPFTDPPDWRFACGCVEHGRGGKTICERHAKWFAEAAGASVPQELAIARREYLDADERGEVESIDELSPATYNLLMAAIAPVVPPTAEDVAWAKGELKELGLTGEASSTPRGER